MLTEQQSFGAGQIVEVSFVERNPDTGKVQERWIPGMVTSSGLGYVDVAMRRPTPEGEDDFEPPVVQQKRVTNSRKFIRAKQ